MDLDKLLHSISAKKILVIGDIMLDHYVWGDVHRISPEAPVPVVHVNKDTYTAGGAANVALNLANLGVQTSILGYCSNDTAGKQLSEIFAQNNIQQVLPLQDSDTPTIIKTRVIIRGQQLCRIDREASRDKYQVEHLLDFVSGFRSAVDSVDAIIISDYAKGVITQTLVDSLMNNSRHKNGDLLIAVDPKPSRKLNYQGAGLITPNKNEAFELSELPSIGNEETYPLNEICKNIESKYQPRLLVITLGANGMAICKNGDVIEVLPTVAREVFDVSGAGDTVIASLTAGLVAGLDAHEAARLANAAAGCVVAHMGTVPIKLNELKEWYRVHNN